MPAAAAVVVRAPGAPIAAGAARSVDQIEAQLRALNDQGKAIYYGSCVWGGPIGCVGDTGFWIYDPAFPGLPANTGVAPCIVDGRRSQNVETITQALHRTRPAYDGLDAKYASASSGYDPYGFVGLQFSTPCDQASTLFLFDVYEECRLALSYLAHNALSISADPGARPILCSEIGRYASCLYDAAARPTPKRAIDVQSPYARASGSGHITIGITPAIVRADDAERVLGRPLRDEDLLPHGAVSSVWSGLTARATDPWSWNDLGPADRTYTTMRAGRAGPESVTISYGGSHVLCLMQRPDGGFDRTIIASGMAVVADAVTFAQYLAPQTMSQLLVAEWAGYVAGPLAAFAGHMGVSADQLAKLQQDAQRAKTLASAHDAIGGAQAAASAAPVVGQTISKVLGWLWDLLSNVLPIASGTLPACPPPFLIRIPSGAACGSLASASALSDAVQGIESTTTAAGVESVHHDVPPPSFSFVGDFVKARTSAAQAKAGKILLGVGAAGLALGFGGWLLFRRKR